MVLILDGGKEIVLFSKLDLNRFPQENEVSIDAVYGADVYVYVYYKSVYGLRSSHRNAYANA